MCTARAAERRMIVRKHCGNCAVYDRENMKHSELCGKCVTEHFPNGKESDPSMWKPLPQTNADRIRAMSDEELAKFIGEEGFHCEICAKGVNSECDLKCGTYCLDWLKQPAEEAEPFLFEKGNQPHGAEQFARACGVCVNHKSELCRDCKTEKKSGFEPPF